MNWKLWIGMGLVTCFTFANPNIVVNPPLDDDEGDEEFYLTLDDPLDCVAPIAAAAPKYGPAAPNALPAQVANIQRLINSAGMMGIAPFPTAGFTVPMNHPVSPAQSITSAAAAPIGSTTLNSPAAYNPMPMNSSPDDFGPILYPDQEIAIEGDGDVVSFHEGGLRYTIRIKPRISDGLGVGRVLIFGADGTIDDPALENHLVEKLIQKCELDAEFNRQLVAEGFYFTKARVIRPISLD